MLDKNYERPVQPLNNALDLLENSGIGKKLNSDFNENEIDLGELYRSPSETPPTQQFPILSFWVEEDFSCYDYEGMLV